MLTQFSKAFSPIVESVLFSVNVACETAEQPLNAFAEINVTLSGIVMPERSIQFSNALCPIVVAVPLPVQSVTVVSAAQSLNAFAPTAVITLGNFNVGNSARAVIPGGVLFRGVVRDCALALEV